MTMTDVAQQTGGYLLPRDGGVIDVWWPYPGEGGSKSSGAITKTGSGLARRLLVESAWHYSRRPAIGATLANRQDGQPDHVLQIAWRAQHRLHRIHHRLRDRGKPTTSRPSPSPANSPASSGPPPPRHDLIAPTTAIRTLGPPGPGQRPPAHAIGL
jgi:hypothetical protein